MPWVIIAVLVGSWGLGLGTSTTAGGLLHLLPVAAALLLVRHLARLRVGRSGAAGARRADRARRWAQTEVAVPPAALRNPAAGRGPAARPENRATAATVPIGSLRVGCFRPRSREAKAALEAASMLLRRG